MKNLAKQFKAKPLFAGLSFLNITRGTDNHDMICGDNYVVTFSGLVKI